MHNQLAEVKQDLIDWFQRIYDRSLTTSSGGNLSVRLDDYVVCSPTGRDKGSLAPRDLCVLQMKECDYCLLNDNKPTCEIQMHLEIYRRRPDIKAIIHAHPVFASLFSVIDTKLRNDLFSETFIFIPRIEYVPYHPPGSRELSLAVGDASGKSNALILRNHGVVLMGDSLTACFRNLEVMEHSAKSQYLLLGRRDVRGLSKEQIEELGRLFHVSENNIELL